tara:strand:+ start:2705 stop:2953 length:249 start_codon:yes stop_codon:yes gene_type:complete
MTVTYKRYFKENVEYEDLATFSERILDVEDYDTGIIEAAAATAANNSRAIGRLLEVLHTADVLTEAEICLILTGDSNGGLKL